MESSVSIEAAKHVMLSFGVILASGAFSGLIGGSNVRAACRFYPSKNRAELSY